MDIRNDWITIECEVTVYVSSVEYPSIGLIWQCGSVVVALANNLKSNAV